MNHFILGGISMASLVAGIFFLRFWKSTGDRFFLFFSVAFGIEAINRACLVNVDLSSEYLPLIYLVRLMAFGLILFAIIDKNWPRRSV